MQFVIDPEPTAPDSVEGRFGVLGRSFGPMLPALRRLHSHLGMNWGQVIVLEQLAFHYRERGKVPSISQAVISRELGLSRTTVHGQLSKLRRTGLIATRPDAFHGAGSRTLHYCIDPCLAAAALIAAQHGDLRSAELRVQGESRFCSFVNEVQLGRWEWSVGDLTTPPSMWRSVAEKFVHLYRLERALVVLPIQPTTSFDRADSSLSWPTTQVDAAIDGLVEAVVSTC